ncbi:MAG: 1-acyl-sn-glycerol-3-phosphate acyltransferase [Liquorilactobacillus nagelii]|jgi:1-acyl-sn-glycerol-3-phosphate acyltransferase|uniref:1-acyl-sn-glycerol-3-phosphate acyltransferase n=1 Tax=Liquorilactobacillus nagelii TaxID=82688 RepID=A0A3Q8CCB6_9LACO|nr:1-acyl-sn-glycerol-3-phosphate acyltransferase [Liquorilactobacillus nagelii]AUJ32266.1 1-acyl-sn-glycerol-3-phosphate acyltransferase [Liquorilactobacillus nagelii]KRL40822.1 1-acyl-sn-glycerol-3-phosphate acyltransferase [Liquorilactobacillus nagelii DSM 13675]MCC7615441.1 1-acyl-sn-glycerol-3-phosphate acyltransferase [Liquorilactobacillus nagelii]MCI1699511.1 1-acyl-sn-glycerol-3-phosphate acyltransferase [Liquorilactobacillus nagelii]MCP9314689.1 1-acyl-sn-glycerol-3-phosphate acyltran
MFYSFIRVVARVILFLINGNAHYLNKEKLPAKNYILVGPHRTWFDMIYFALGAAPKKFSFMAKKELFKNSILRFILVHANAFPVDRKNPGPSAIKTPVRWLQKRDLSLIMFPSGTRHSQKLKGGVILIAKLAKVPIVPAVYQGPLTFKQLLTRKKVIINFGDPITVDPKGKLNSELEQKVIAEMTASFKKLDQEIDPNFIYQDPKQADK